MTFLSYVIPFGFGAGALLDLDATLPFVIVHIVCTSFLLAFEFLPAVSRLSKIAITPAEDTIAEQVKKNLTLKLQKYYLLKELQDVQGMERISSSRSSLENRVDRLVSINIRRQLTARKLQFLVDLAAYQCEIKEHKKKVTTIIETCATERVRSCSKDCKGLESTRYQLRCRQYPTADLTMGESGHLFVPSIKTVVDDSNFSRHLGRYTFRKINEITRQ
jgi:hypothetical protein